MSTEHQHPAQRAAWLEAVERFAQRADDAPLALAALGVRYHADSAVHLAAVLFQLARYTGDRAAVVLENGKRTADAQREWGAESAALLARGWGLLAIEREARPHA